VPASASRFARSRDAGGGSTPAPPFASRRPSFPDDAGFDAEEAAFTRGPAMRRRGVTPPPLDQPAPTFALSPRMTAIFGALFGLATITTIIALLIQAVPPRDDRSLASASPSSSALAAGDGAPGQRPSKKRVRTPIPGPWRLSALEKDPSVRIVEGEIDRQSFVVALGDKKIEKSQIYRILKAFDGVHSFDKTKRHDKFIVAVDRQTKEVKAFEYVVSPEEIYQAREVNGLLAATQLDLKIANEEVTGSIYVGKNLAKSIDEGGFEHGLEDVLDDAVAGRTSTEGFEEGATLRVIAIETTALGEFTRYKQIVAVEYRPPDPSAAPLRAYAFEDGRVHGYYDEKGRSPDGSGWTFPVPGAPITSRYNPKRMHPILHKIVSHHGTDFGAPSGTPIYAAFKGKITHAGPAGACGNMVTIDHPGDIQTGYCHMSKFAPGLKEGMSVGTNQLIGYVGTTGRSTGPHLHFWAKRKGAFFDAETLKMNGLHPLPPEERDAFAAKKAELDARLDAIPLPEPPPTEPAPEAKPEASTAPVADDTKPSLGAEDPTDGDDGDDDDKGKSHKKSASDDEHASKPSKPAVDEDSGDDILGPDLGG
jgi:murein DD-endopeptidase MepM/ murein hydrolase activator NlpD